MWKRGDSSDSESSVGDAAAARTLEIFAGQPLNLCHRPPTTPAQHAMSCFCWGQVLFQVACAALVMKAQNMEHPRLNDAMTKLTCSKGFMHDAHYHRLPVCIKEELRDAIQSCKSLDSSYLGIQIGPFELLGGDDNVDWSSETTTFNPDSYFWDPDKDPMWKHTGRLLSHNSNQRSDKTMSQLFSTNLPRLWYLFPSAVLSCIAWLFCLKKAARAVIWGSVILTVLLICYFYYLTANASLLLVAAFVAILTVWRRKDLELTISAANLAAQALDDSSAHVFTVAMVIQFVWIAYVLSYLHVSQYIHLAVDVTRKGEGCSLGRSFATVPFTYLCPILFCFTTAFCQHCMLASCVWTVAASYFPDEAKAEGMPPNDPSVAGAKLALTSSSGCVGMASVVTAFVEYVKQKDDDKCCWWCSVDGVIYKVIALAVDESVESVTRFALIGHLLHGCGLCDASTQTSELLKKYLPSVILSSFFFDKVMSDLAYGLATAMSFWVWYIIDESEQLGVFAEIASTAENTDIFLAQWCITLLILLMQWLVRRPLRTLFCVGTVIAFVDIQESHIAAFMLSISLGSIFCILFRSFGMILGFASDGMFYCAALAAEGGRRSVRLKGVQDFIAEQVSSEQDSGAYSENEPC